MSVSNPSLNRLLSASPFDLAPRDSASGRFNQHLHVRRREGGALPSSTNGGAATAVTATAATNHMCDQCGGIGGHATGCTAAGVAAGGIPVVERWLGKPVSLPGDADYPNTYTTPTNSARITPIDTQAPHPVFDQCSCNRCRDSRAGDCAVGSPSASSMALTDLPEPLLVLICKDLGFQSLCRVSQVCRGLYLAARDATLWRELVLDPFIIPDEVLTELCNRSAAINALSLVCQGSSGVTDAGIATVSAQSSLTMLALQNCRLVSPSMLVTILENNTRLTHLNIKNCRQVTDSVPHAIGRHCTKIVSLNLMGCRNLTDDGLRELATLKRIEELNLWGGGKWTDNVLAGLVCGSFQTLKVLELRFCKQVTNGTISAIASNCDRIERLGLAYCTALTDHALDTLLENCPKLVWLNVRDCPQISTAARTRFMEKRPFCHLLFNKIV